MAYGIAPALLLVGLVWVLVRRWPLVKGPLIRGPLSQARCVDHGHTARPTADPL
jgi:hypothetical protein